MVQPRTDGPPFDITNAYDTGVWLAERSGFLSPNVRSDGSYDPERDTLNPNPEEGGWVNPWINRTNTTTSLLPGDEVLVVEAVWVKENMEGETCDLLAFEFHGPFGKLYIQTHPTDMMEQNDESCPHCSLRGSICLNLIQNTAINGYKRFRLRGPFRGPPPCCICFFSLPLVGCVAEICAPKPSDEFLDGTFIRYRAGWAGIHKWGPGETSIMLSVVESDTDNTDDLAGPVLVSKIETSSACGVWMPLRQYTPVHWGRYSDGTFGTNVCIELLDLYPVVLRLRTIRCTGTPGDPC